MSEYNQCKTVVIAQDNLMRTLLARIIQLNERFSLVADCDEIRMAQETCIRLEPELVIIDVDFAPDDTLTLIEILVKEPSTTRVLALSGSNDPALLHRLYQSRIDGFVPRSETIEFFEEAMQEVASGRRYLPAAFLRQQAESVQQRQRLAQRLTKKEQAILHFIAAGYTSRSMALELRLSPRSVETYRGRIKRKLGVANTAALVEYALRSGFLALVVLAAHLWQGILR